MSRADLQALAANGSDRVTDTSVYHSAASQGSGGERRPGATRWVAFKAETDCVFGAGCVGFGDDAEAPDPPQDGETLAAGDVWYGPLIAFQLASGSGRLIRH